jgi:hypothetical protein
VKTSSTLETRVLRGGRCCCALLSLCAVATLCAAAAPAGTGDPAVAVTVLENTPERIVLSYSFDDYIADTVLIDGRDYTLVSLGRESRILRTGAPDLPSVCRSVIIPDAAVMTAKVISGDFYEISDIDIAPSKGNLYRDINPDDVAYTFGDVYDRDADYPGELATLGEPYILRDYRGIVVRVNPFQYNPVTRRLRVYTALTVEIVNTVSESANDLRIPGRQRELSLAFHQVYKHHFLNYDNGLRYEPLDEVGELLIICYDAWIPNVQPLVDHKNSIGIATNIVGVSSIGNNATAIDNYIQGVYDTSDLAFVLLVGDATQVATPYASGGAADPTYALVAGSDHYPDIFVGRFSAETSAQVDTQVERTIEYELMPATLQDWFWRGVGIGSSQGAGIGDDGEADYVHIGNIRTDLLNHGYTVVDQIYDPGASAAAVSNAVNAGRGIINYCGHGSTYAWSTTGFSVSHVNALVNDNMLPFIVSVACVNGQFAGYTCFAEAWLRATNNGEPTGAIGMYASSINQSWAPPMAAQDETVDLLCAESYFSYGALCFAGSCQMMDEYGYDGIEMFDTWHVFGDPSVRVVGVAEPPTGLKVTGADLAASGQKGGPFTPDSTIYTLENKNETPMDYEVTASVEWVDIANATGTLPGLGTIEVTISLNEQANALLHGLHEGAILFTNLTDHDGDAERPVSVDVDDLLVRYSFPLDSDPGWTAEGQWAFGVPLRGGSHDGDPDTGHTGSNVYGFNLLGDYTNNMPPYYLTTAPIDCTHLSFVEVRFWRWLGVEKWDGAGVEVSNDGSTWIPAWANPSGVSISDSTWVPMTLDISTVADGAPTVYLRWRMGPTDGTITYPGWNIDDVEIWGASDGEPIMGDLDGDGDVDLDDLAQLLANYGMPNGATYEDGDLDGDGDVDLADLSILLGNYGAGL